VLQLQMGQRFKLVGNLETLGSWSHWDAPAFTWSEEHVWQLSLELPAGDPVEFKIVQAAEDTGDKYWCVWQEGENTILDPVAMGLRVRNLSCDPSTLVTLHWCPFIKSPMSRCAGQGALGTHR
jgi:Starch binding domain